MAREDVKDQHKSKEELLEEIKALKERMLELKDSESQSKQVKEELQKAEEELEIQKWGLVKTNEAIKVLYKELEKKNKELHKLDDLKSEFINTVSHELRTPLTTIREVVAQILEGILGQTTPEQREFLSICLEDVDRLKRIIDNLLDIAKLEAGGFKLKKEEVDIIDLAKGVIAIFSPKATSMNLEIKGDFPSEKAIGYADKDRIIQVFTNLVGNALKFCDKGYILISVVDKPEHIECCVYDTGKGISEDDLPKIFSKFQQFNRADGPGEKGTGLGLSISKSIIELHNGKIWVESKLNEWTKFTFTLPKYNLSEQH
jgi:signal transduction histidine kinase